MHRLGRGGSRLYIQFFAALCREAGGGVRILGLQSSSVFELLDDNGAWGIQDFGFAKVLKILASLKS